MERDKVSWGLWSGLSEREIKEALRRIDRASADSA